MLFTKQNIPSYLIFTIDLVLVIFSVILAYLLRFNFAISRVEMVALPNVLIFILIVRGLSFYLARTYSGIIRYTSTEDAIKFFTVIGAGSLFFVLTNIVTYYTVNRSFLIPFSIIIIDFICTNFSLIGYRLIVKIAFMEMQNPSKTKTNVIIFGAGESGLITKRAMDRDAGTKYKVLAFIDEDPNKINKKLEGVTIYGPQDLESLLKTNTIAHIIISIQNLNPKKKEEITDTCLPYNTKILVVPPVSRWINGELSFKQIKKIKIEDLLEREVITLDKHIINKELAGKTVMITGAAGSIGSEMVRQIAHFSYKKMILVDQAETPLYHLELELIEDLKAQNYEIVLGDICNKEKMSAIFEAHKPDFIYHAAAYKHVPLMESNPIEAIHTNVIGTKIIADLAVKHLVKKFVMVSTDKAVNPTSVMGASKRIAEIYTQSLNQKKITRFITTRFGNVLGSNGSVIPLFKEQIDKGGPITITHPDVTRFFMTIPEACQLVLEAGVMGNGGEIFIFDMGKSVKIVDLAKKMIRLSGLTLGKDIQIVYTGLRPGEKLYEELLNNHENTLPTHHPQIMIGKVKEYDLDGIAKETEALQQLLFKQETFDLVKKMKEIIPEYKSKNSVYEQLDAN